MSYKHIPPANIPEDSKCYPLYIPDDDDYIPHVLDVLRSLTYDRRWQRDNVGGDHVIAVRNTFRDMTLIPFLDAVQNETPCGDSSIGECFQLGTETSVIQFFNNDPFSDAPETRPTIGQWERWVDAKARLPDIFEDALALADDFQFFDSNIGYYDNDCFVVPNDEENPLSEFLDLINAVVSFQVPRIEIDLIGTGQFEVELLNVPSGGAAIIVWDNDDPINAILDFFWNNNGELTSPNIISTELQRQVLSLPPEQLERNSVEIELGGDENTTHKVKIWFVPRVSTQLAFLGYGGGVRSVTACGSLRFLDKRIPENPKEVGIRNYGLSQHNREGVIQVTTAQELCEAVECGIERIAQRIVSGQSGNIVGDVTIGADGTVTIGGSGIGGGGTDASLSRSLMGEAEYIENQLEEFIQDFEDFYTLYGGGVLSIEASLKAKYRLDENNLNTVVTDYANFIGGGGSHPPQTLNGLDRVIYCKGSDKTVINSWILEDTLAEPLLRIDMVSLLLDSQFDLWRDQSNSVSDDYKNAECYVLPPQDYTDDAGLFLDGSAGISYFTGLQTKAQRTYEVLISGEITMSNGRVFDGLYTNNAGTILPTSVRLADASFGVLPESVPIYSNGAGYSLLYKYNRNNPCSRFFFNDGDWVVTDGTGELKFTIIDRGVL